MTCPDTVLEIAPESVPEMVPDTIPDLEVSPQAERKLYYIQFNLGQIHVSLYLVCI